MSIKFLATLLTTAPVVAGLLAGPAFSQADDPLAARIKPEYITAEDLEDASILSLEGSYDENVWSSGEPLEAIVADLEEIGDVEDIVLSPDGMVAGLTTDVGGFIGIGEKTILIPLEDLRVAQSSDTDDVRVITRLDRAALEELEEFEMDD